MSRKQRKVLRRKGITLRETPQVEHKTAPEPETKSSGILGFYEKQYKPLLIIPFAILLIAILILGVKFATTGEFINKGVSLSGGVAMTIHDPTIDRVGLEAFLESKYDAGAVSIRSLSRTGDVVGVVIEVGQITSDELLSTIREYLPELSSDQYSIEETGSSLGASFFRETIYAVIAAFILMGAVVFFYFRNFVPSIAVILAALSDMIVTLAIVSMMGMQLSSAGVAAFLMLIGYSVDTDILLSTRVLKREHGTIFERVISAAKTGLTMNVTTLAAVVITLVLSQSEILKQMMTILLIGLIIDIINTWIQNAGLLRWYLEK